MPVTLAKGAYVPVPAAAVIPVVPFPTSVPGCDAASGATAQPEFDFGEDGGETWETNWIMDFTRVGEDR